jgi:hypothetical protein
VEGTLAWSKILFTKRKRFWTTDRGAGIENESSLRYLPFVGIIMIGWVALVKGGKEEMIPRVAATVSLTKDEIVHLYSGGVLNVRIKGKEAEATLELSGSDAPPTRATRMRFKTITAE